MTNKLFSLNDVSKTFGGGFFSRRRVHAVDRVTLEMPGEQPGILAVIGQSGSGKSTLARMLLRLVTPSSGRVQLDGRDVAAWPIDAFRRTVQPVFQNPFEAFSLHKPVDFYLHRTAINLAGARDLPAARTIAAEALHAVGLSPDRVAGKYIQQFSGGELQRLSIARALIPGPRLIVADEPVSMVDASLRTNIVNLFLSLKRDRGVSFLYITHDLSTAYYVADQVAIMRDGSIVEAGAPDTVLRNPQHEYTRALLDAVPGLGERWVDAA